MHSYMEAEYGARKNLLSLVNTAATASRADSKNSARRARPASLMLLSLVYVRIERVEPHLAFGLVQFFGGNTS